MANDIELPWDQYIAASMVGLLRYADVLGNGRKSASQKHRTWDEQRADHMRGAVGECAAAAMLGRYWPASLNTFHNAPDIGSNTEVRYSEHGPLKVRPGDPRQANYILVTGAAPFLTMVGYLPGNECIRAEWQRNPGQAGPAWFVPRDALRPIPETWQARPVPSGEFVIHSVAVDNSTHH